MPKQGKQSHSVYPEHAEQVRQKDEPKGELVFATGENWAGNNKTDSMIMKASPESWVEAVLER